MNYLVRLDPVRVGCIYHEALDSSIRYLVCDVVRSTDSGLELSFRKVLN